MVDCWLESSSKDGRDKCKEHRPKSRRANLSPWISLIEWLMGKTPPAFSASDNERSERVKKVSRWNDENCPISRHRVFLWRRTSLWRTTVEQIDFHFSSISMMFDQLCLCPLDEAKRFVWDKIDQFINHPCSRGISFGHGPNEEKKFPLVSAGHFSREAFFYLCDRQTHVNAAISIPLTGQRRNIDLRRRNLFRWVEWIAE